VYVPGITFDTSFWRCNQCSDKRAARRYRLDEKQSHIVLIRKRGVVFEAQLKDISSTGARLEGKCGYYEGCISEGEDIEFNAGVSANKVLSKYMDSKVKWISAGFFGVQFMKNLAGEEEKLLQKLIS